MSSNTQNRPSPSQGVPSITPHPQSRKHSYASPSTTSCEPPSKRKKHMVEDQRRELTQSIISNLPRDKLEKLLLDAALGHAGVMQGVIAANSLKWVGAPSSEDNLSKERAPEVLHQSQESHQEIVASEVLSDDGQTLDVRGLDGEGSPGSVVTVVNVDMDTIPGMDGDGPLQFHHVTQRQFEKRKARIMEILRRSSPTSMD